MSDIMKTIKENDVKFVDLRFTDTKGKEQHVTLPASAVDESIFENGKYKKAILDFWQPSPRQKHNFSIPPF